jgi:hypothetical protein
MAPLHLCLDQSALRRRLRMSMPEDEEFEENGGAGSLRVEEGVRAH